MKDIERAKQLQRRLWQAIGRTWTESQFDSTWIYKPFGADWDHWYRNHLLPVDFCALCGDDNIAGDVRDRAWWSNRNSALGVRIFLCDDCYEARLSASGQSVESQQTPVPITAIYGSQVLKHSLYLFVSVFVWYPFMPSGISNLNPVAVAAISIWYITWIGSIQSIPSVNTSRSPLAMGFFMPPILLPIVRFLPFLVYASIVLVVAALIIAFHNSTHCGIVTIVACIMLYLVYGIHWRRIQIKRGLLGVY